MKSAAPSRRDRLRHILADLRMPGALEALDAILPASMAARSRPQKPSSSYSPRRFSCAITDGSKRRCVRADCR